MPEKEDRSSWVAVAPEFENSGTKIKPATSAYQFFQKEAGESIKQDLIRQDGKFEVGRFSRLVRDRWNALGPEDKRPYEDMAARDMTRFSAESHAADVAAMERKARLQQERQQLMIDDEGGDKRNTRRQQAKKERKKKRKELKESNKKPKSKSDNANESSDSYHDESSSSEESYDSDDSDHLVKKKKAKPAPRQMSQKQIEYREKAREEKLEKERYIENRQEILRKERADQAKRRLTFLLKQSSIFSHFGAVQEDQARFGIKASAPKKADGVGDGAASSRRDLREGDVGDQQDAADLEEGDESQATFLTSQPTTLGFGKMRPYQLEGLNWMVRLQENGVNGILADEMGLVRVLLHCCRHWSQKLTLQFIFQ